MALTQSESDIIHRRLAAFTVSGQGLFEEALRIQSQAQTRDLGNTLLDPSAPETVVRADAIALYGNMQEWIDFYNNLSVPADANRRANFNKYLINSRALGA